MLNIDIFDYYAVARGGIEPPTHGFSVRCPLVISVTYPRNRCGQVWTYRKSVDKICTKLYYDAKRIEMAEGSFDFRLLMAHYANSLKEIE